MKKFIIEREALSLTSIMEALESRAAIELSASCRAEVENCRSFLETYLDEADKPIYGVNTGFGSLRNKEISREQISTLQRNLVLSHACGVGDDVDIEIIRTILLLKIINLSLGKSGIQIQTLDRLVALYNNEVFPVIYEQGSLGASGDLAPLAHLSLVLIGEGEVYYKNEKCTAADALRKLNLQPLDLGAKEGLALLNGTQFMSAYGFHMLRQLHKLIPKSELVTAMSIDAFAASLDPFSVEIQEARPHQGQGEVARKIREILADSEIAHSSKTDVQDPYSFRCIPQVHGASMDAIRYAESVIECEILSVTDNPMVFPEAGRVISAGNFHGQPLALAFDFLAIAIAELASISERRIYKLISGQRGLPDFLVGNPGLNSGFMIPQYTAASLVSQNKQLCTPASVDTIDSSNGQEDHVSMGANAALKCLRVLKNYRQVLAIELMNAAQALEFRRPEKSSAAVEKFFEEFRKHVPFVKEDRQLQVLMKAADNFLAV